jgi:hypothetical protein
MSSLGSSLHAHPRLVQAPRDLILRVVIVILMTWPFVVAALVIRSLFRTVW